MTAGILMRDNLLWRFSPQQGAINGSDQSTRFPLCRVAQ